MPVMTRSMWKRERINDKIRINYQTAVWKIYCEFLANAKLEW